VRGGARPRRLHASHDIYAFEAELAALCPGSNNVRPKIRQQLQVLRDQGYLQFVGRGRYRLAVPE
jgi:type II restriction enzyme